MRYFKDANDGFYALSDGLEPMSDWVEITDEEAKELRHVPQADQKADASAYLNATDWYVIRFAETGVAVPEEVTAKRAEARTLL